MSNVSRDDGAVDPFGFDERVPAFPGVRVRRHGGAVRVVDAGGLSIAAGGPRSLGDDRLGYLLVPAPALAGGPAGVSLPLDRVVRLIAAWRQVSATGPGAPRWWLDALMHYVAVRDTYAQRRRDGLSGARRRWRGNGRGGDGAVAAAVARHELAEVRHKD